jgi:hypothetical protein
MFAVNRDGKDFRILAPTLKGQANRNQLVYRYAQLLSVLRDGTDDILVAANEPDARLPDVYRMNTSTGRKTLKSTEKPGDVVLWVADRKGAVSAAVEVDKGTTVRVFWRPDEHSKWVRLAEANHRDAMFIQWRSTATEAFSSRPTSAAIRGRCIATTRTNGQSAQKSPRIRRST